MTVKDVLDIVIIPVVLAILALAWPAIQSRNSGKPSGLI
jgi:hypothetical protein